jgi:hypothetical protein
MNKVGEKKKQDSVDQRVLSHIRLKVKTPGQKDKDNQHLHQLNFHIQLQDAGNLLNAFLGL